MFLVFTEKKGKLVDFETVTEPLVVVLVRIFIFHLPIARDDGDIVGGRVGGRFGGREVSVRIHSIPVGCNEYGIVCLCRYRRVGGSWFVVRI